MSAAPSTHGAVLGDQHPGELADGGGLAGAVDADDQHDGGPAVRAGRRAASGPASGSTRVSSSSRSRARTDSASRDAERLDPGAQPLDQLLGRADADVGGEQGVLDLLPGVLVEPVAGQQGEQAAAEGALRAASRPRSRTSRPAAGSGVSVRAAGAVGSPGGATTVTSPVGSGGRSPGRSSRSVSGGRAALPRPRPAPAAAQQRETAPDEDGESEGGQEDDEGESVHRGQSLRWPRAVAPWAGQPSARQPRPAVTTRRTWRSARSNRSRHGPGLLRRGQDTVRRRLAGVDPVGQLGHLVGQALGPGDLAAAVEDGHDTHDEQGDETEEQVSQQECGHPDHVTGTLRVQTSRSGHTGVSAVTQSDS